MTTPQTPAGKAHRLLMPPHPGDIYQSSALCSCGEWQYDADSQVDLLSDYRAVLRDHTAHLAATATIAELNEADVRRVIAATLGAAAEVGYDFDFDLDDDITRRALRLLADTAPTAEPYSGPSMDSQPEYFYQEPDNGEGHTTK